MSIENLVRSTAYPLAGDNGDFDPLLEMIGDARLVLLGEATHGTHEFYQARARITRRLIEEKSFAAVAVEADWPDAYRVNRYVRLAGSDQTAVEALDGFERFPRWMWRNADVLDFVGWLRSFNEGRPPESRTGFYGLDLYSLHGSMDEVIRYLAKVDPEAASRARARYRCFDHFGPEPQTYGYVTSLGLTETCEQEVITQLIELRRSAAEYASRDGRIAADDFFFAEQNARLVKNAEEYYRSMFRARVLSWNLRDRHMMETLEALLGFLDRDRGGRSRVAVWAHNSHLGDARATRMGAEGELNVGQLARERFGDDAVLVGFTTHTGTVTAASDWDAPVERKRVRPSLAGSVEALFHASGVPRFFLRLRGAGELTAALADPRLERAIGVIYLPETERASHYFDARASRQFDAVFHYDETRALEPLDRTPGWERPDEVPETFPSGV